jgi:hypothetical protein
MYSSFYPIIEGADPRYQHFVLLFVVIWLNTVGPQEKLLHKIYAITKQDERITELTEKVRVLEAEKN